MKRISILAIWLTISMVIFTNTGCQKDVPQVNTSNIATLDHDLATEWYKLALSLVDRTNGYAEPIAARAMSYLGYTLYESSVSGMKDYKTQQTLLDGFQLTLPQADANKEYYYTLVANEAMYVIVRHLFGASGSESYAKIEALRSSFEKRYSAGIASVVREDSKKLGKSIGEAIALYSDSDQQSHAYLENYPSNYVPPTTPGSWVPTPPDYSDKLLLPKWGNVRGVIYSNALLQPIKPLEFSGSNSSTMYAEANECFAMSTNLTEDQKLKIDFWDKTQTPVAAPVCRSLMLTVQLIEEKNLNYGDAVEVLTKMSWALHDSYILAWKVKYETYRLRPATYIRTYISRFYVPPTNASATPDFVSENGLVYKAASVILSNYFDRKNNFVDRTQLERSSLLQKVRSYSDFESWANEGAYTDILTSVHFRTSIDAGYDLGYKVGQSILAIKLK
ncbi:MAG: hypothetical protein IPL98_17870 [Saprospiraceae bacterium]|nr:hypothetical protein [Saprospiraceae bacterium]